MLRSSLRQLRQCTLRVRKGQCSALLKDLPAQVGLLQMQGAHAKGLPPFLGCRLLLPCGPATPPMYGCCPTVRPWSSPFCSPAGAPKPPKGCPCCPKCPYWACIWLWLWGMPPLLCATCGSALLPAGVLGMAGRELFRAGTKLENTS